MGSNTPTSNHLDPHEAPPKVLKDVYKSWTGASALTEEHLRQGLLDPESLKAGTGTEAIAPEVLDKYFKEFLANNGFQTDLSEAVGTSESDILSDSQKSPETHAVAYEIKRIPGRKIFGMTCHCVVSSWSTAFLSVIPPESGVPSLKIMVPHIVMKAQNILISLVLPPQHLLENYDPF
jgi:hypothetical protein